MMPAMDAQMPKPAPKTSTSVKIIQLAIITIVQWFLPSRLHGRLCFWRSHAAELVPQSWCRNESIREEQT